MFQISGKDFTYYCQVVKDSKDMTLEELIENFLSAGVSNKWEREWNELYPFDLLFFWIDLFILALIKLTYVFLLLDFELIRLW